MVVTGIVRNGVVVLDQNTIPEGTQVKVEPVDQGSRAAQEGVGQKMLKYAGQAEDLPPDVAEQHNHYLYGTPKR